MFNEAIYRAMSRLNIRTNEGSLSSLYLSLVSRYDYQYFMNSRTCSSYNTSSSCLLVLESNTAGEHGRSAAILRDRSYDRKTIIANKWANGEGERRDRRKEKKHLPATLYRNYRAGIMSNRTAIEPCTCQTDHLGAPSCRYHFFRAIRRLPVLNLAGGNG